MPEYKIIKEDGKEYIAKDIDTLKKWIEEKKVKPNEQVYHPILEKWIYIKDMFKIKEVKESIPKKKFYMGKGFWTGFIIMSLGFLVLSFWFIQGSYKAGIVGMQIMVIGFIVLLIAIKRNKQTFLISGGLVILLILSNVILVGWKNRNVKIKKVTGVKCSYCDNVFTADTTTITIPVKEKGDKDFIFEYEDTLCVDCTEKISKEADKLFGEGKKAYQKSDYNIAKTKFTTAKSYYLKVKNKKSEDVEKWLKKTQNKIISKVKKEQEKAKITARKVYEKLAREAFLDKGWDIKVKVHGSKNKYITLTWIGIGDVFVHNFKKSPMCQEMQELGFERIYLKDGYRYSTYIYWKN